MSSDASRDLDAWVPRLIDVWRQRRAVRGAGGPRRGPKGRPPLVEGPADRLTPPEVKEVATGIKRLSLGLTRQRELAGAAYMDDPQLLGAYLLFYWPVSYAQARALLTELPARPRTLLDLGSGPGPVAFAGIDAGARETIAADRSRPALELARQLAIAASESLGTREWSPERPLPDGTYDVVTMGHVVNELFGGDLARRAQLLEQVLGRVKPGGSLVVMEPALRDTSRALLAVRDALVAKGFAVRAPCLFRGPCPALLKPSDWCHAERTWRLPPLTEALARAAGLHKESLKMSYLVLAPKGEAWAEPPPGRVFRVVSEALEGKGRQRYMGCGPEGRLGLALQDKHRTEANARFFHLARGEVIRLSGATEEKGDGVGLSDATTVELVARAGQLVPKPE
ncbi:MAG: methyltransferase domain-containing protein [Myxococcaceae bacterium]|jgi:SAM-dependent methyltransferase|nr:methyltransferase domain-containing protein [Myxococcaceae bacterium]MCA3012313.1 methyltransferase domain-containing protein [Myxococcaceae bacterium]